MTQRQDGLHSLTNARNPPDSKYYCTGILYTTDTYQSTHHPGDRFSSPKIHLPGYSTQYLEGFSSKYLNTVQGIPTRCENITGERLLAGAVVQQVSPNTQTQTSECVSFFLQVWSCCNRFRARVWSVHKICG